MSEKNNRPIPEFENPSDTPVSYFATDGASDGPASGNPKGKRENSGKKALHRDRKKKAPLWITLPVLVLILALVGWQAASRLLTKPAVSVQAQRLSQATRGNLTVSVTGSGPLQPVSKRTVSTELNTTILEILKKNGDAVQAGEILATLDASDAETALSSAESSLEEELADADTTTEEILSLMVRAPFDGLVSELSVKAGDTVSKNGSLMTLTDVDHLIVTVPFGISDMAALQEGQTATLSFSSLSGTATGSVSHVGENGYRSTDGGEAVDVEISVDNPGALAAGMTATVEIHTSAGLLFALSEATLAYAEVKVLRSDAGGDVQSVAVRENQRIKSGSLLLVMENTDLSKTARTAETRIANLTRSVENAQADVDSCVVRAPMDGIVTGLDATVGDSVKSGAALCSILDTTAMTLEVSIDELDIASISPGQSVTATVDAVSDTEATPLTGTVTSIAVEGSSSNGVTTYPVTLTLNPDARLKSGMNADASILVTNKENVLLVPIEAVTTLNGRSFVYVSGTPSGTTTEAGIGTGGRMAAGFNPAAMPGNAAVPGTGASVRGNEVSGQRPRGSRTGPRTASGGAVSGNSMPGGSWGAGTNAMTGYYAGAVLVRVETGAHNETYMEIISGLSETDQVILPALTTTAGTSTTGGSSGFGFPGMGGIGGAIGGPQTGTRTTGTGTTSGTRSSGSTVTGQQGAGDFGPPPN